MLEILNKHDLLQYANNYGYKGMFIHLKENLKNESKVFNVNWAERIKDFIILNEDS